MSIGLSKQQIIDSLTKSGIKEGEGITAEHLAEAIATVILQNNNVLEKQITGIVGSDLKRMMKGIY